MQMELTFAAEKPVNCTRRSIEMPSTSTSRMMIDSSTENAGAVETGVGGGSTFLGRLFATGGGMRLESASATSAAHLTSVAPLLIRLRHPALRGESTLPGTAITVRPMSAAIPVVIRVPLFAGASIATTPDTSAATTWLR